MKYFAGFIFGGFFVISCAALSPSWQEHKRIKAECWKTNERCKVIAVEMK
jgi:hypothetical protein